MKEGGADHIYVFRIALVLPLVVVKAFSLGQEVGIVKIVGDIVESTVSVTTELVTEPTELETMTK